MFCYTRNHKWLRFCFAVVIFSSSVFVMFLIKWPMVKETFYLCLTCLIHFILLLNCIGSIVSWLNFCCNGKNCTKWIFHVIIEKKKKEICTAIGHFYIACQSMVLYTNSFIFCAFLFPVRVFFFVLLPWILVFHFFPLFLFLNQ